MRRQIRLKEWEPNSKRTMAPPATLIEQSDGSLRPDSVAVSVSNDGFVYDPDRPDSFDSRIVVMGDSVVECSYVPEGFRFTDIAEKELRSRGVSARVENAGRSGATILQLTLALQAKILPMRPDKIVLMNGIIDSDAVQFASGLWSKGDYINPIEEEKIGHPAPKKLTELDFTARTKFLRLFADTCRLFEIELFIATTPLRENDEYMDRYLAKNGQRNIRVEAVNNNTRQFCENNGVRLIDLDKILNRESKFFYDYFHFNPCGAEHAGRVLAENLMSW